MESTRREAVACRDTDGVAIALTGEPIHVTTSWVSAAQSVAIIGQLLLLIVVVRSLKLEGDAFAQVLMLATGGFAIHHLLAMRWRLPFFGILSLLGIGLVFGVGQGLGLIAIGMVLIGICHLPCRLAIRVALLCIAGIVLVAFRAHWISVPGLTLIWPVLGSMFMFRLMIYMYDLKHRAATFSFWHAVSYFFMLPNVCFPLFPVVDYKTFCRTYFNDDSMRGYQIGVQWIFRGVIHLMLYRFIYQVVQIDPSAVTDDAQLMRYMLATYLLYLHVSGQFHIIVGMLRLFGFNLPETHHLYLLSSSFTDFWRRINIYWKDFIQKLIFYPTYFRLKKMGQAKAIVLSTVIAFAATWLLHSYQWFWLRGTWHAPIQDVVFWAAFCALVIINTLWERKRGRKRSLSQEKGWTWRQELGRASRTIGTFVVILVMWSFWTSDSVGEWATMIGQARHMTWAGALFILVVLGAIGAGSLLLGRRTREWTDRAKKEADRDFAFWRSVSAVALGCAFVFVLTRGRVSALLGSDAAAVIQSVRSGRLNSRDQSRLQRGYYEDLIGGSRFNPALSRAESQRPADWVRIQDTAASVETGNFLRMKLVPSIRIVYKRSDFSTNRWGMRDREYEKEKAPGTYRVAVIGASITQGLGVDDDQVYEHLVESRLNAQSDGEGDQVRYEILNFAVESYGPMRRLMVLEQRVFDFDPDVVVMASTALDFHMVVWDLSHAIANDVSLPFAGLDEMMRAAGATRGVPRVIMERRLEERNPALLEWSYRRFARVCQEHGVEAQLLVLPFVLSRRDADVSIMVAVAEESGLDVLDLSKAYLSTTDREALTVAPWDGHPNAAGHQLLADELYRVLQADGLWGHTPTDR